MKFNLKLSFLLVFAGCLFWSGNDAFAQNNSVLSAGEWYKLAVEKSGIYKIDYDFLQNIGIDPASVNPNHIQIYGNGGKLLPQANSAERPVDLIENAIWVEGAADGKFDASDYILFYGQTPDRINYNSSTGTFDFSPHLFENQSYYFLTVGDVNGKRIGTAPNQGTGFPVVSTYDHYMVHHEDKTNIIISGREWYGDRFDAATSARTYNFSIPTIKSGSTLKLTSAVMGQSYEQNTFDVFVNNSNVGAHVIDAVTTYQYGLKGRDHTSVFESTVTGSSVEVKLSYNLNNSGRSLGYLNYLLLHSKCELIHQNEPLVFRSIASMEQPLSTFEIEEVNTTTQVWDITNAFEPKRQEATTNNRVLKFGAVTVTLNEYVIFDKAETLIPEHIGEIENQNLHAYSATDLLIVTPPELQSEAERLAQFRRENDGLDVIVASTNQIYNEFSGGSVDFTAIRDFARHLYSNGGLKHVLLFGKGTYDYKNVYGQDLIIVPIYESRNSLHPLLTYSSDDYFGFMEDDEGEWGEDTSGDHTLDIGVGRLPVKNLTEATGVVDKLISYSSDQELGKWKNKIVFVADDGDGNLHQSQADKLANFVDTTYFKFNINRLFLDDFLQESKPGGEESRDAEEALNRVVDEGALIVNYTGHGGESGWAQEGMLDIFAIDAWKNNPRLPLFVTATCEFGRHDDPRRDSGGEKTILNPNGGAIALITTARPVDANTNFELNKAFYNAVFAQSEGVYQSLGDIFRSTKNNSLKGSLNRNFSLLGDPSMRIAYPRYSIVIDQLNGRVLTAGQDTLKALSKINLKGSIRNDNGQLISAFKGKSFITVFDKPIEQETLGNENPPFVYEEWDNVMYNGQVSVVDGQFEAEFIMPKNLDYAIGRGRISLYAVDESNKMDAHGADIEVLVGGSENEGLDTTPPEIALYVNDTTFKAGSVTSENILLLAYLFDENGINTSSSNVTNNIVATLDGEKEYTLNKEFTADLDTYTSGWVAFPINNLDPGEHELQLTASDTYNNMGKATIRFVVSNSGGLVIEELGNYPNPVKNETQFYVRHNRAGEDLRVELSVIKTSGELIVTLNQDFTDAQSTLSIYEWLMDEVPLSKGTYVYRVKMRSLVDGAENQRFQKFIKVY